MEKLVNQHGDVLIFAVDSLPGNLKKKPAKNGKYVLAEGEVTNHFHVVPACPEVDFYEDENGTLYLTTTKPVPLTHEEHKKQMVQPGTYRIGRVLEMDPFEDEIREVKD